MAKETVAPPKVKLEQFVILLSELQAYLDQYQDKIKFMLYSGVYNQVSPKLLLIIDVS